jgi:hypothetical protein
MVVKFPPSLFCDVDKCYPNGPYKQMLLMSH